MRAAFSNDGAYRYALWRNSGALGERTLLFVMLNPSTADETQDDPTIRRCIRFARDWGYSRLIVGNAYALRATNPRELGHADDPVGPDNNEWLEELALQADEVVVAWGANIKTDREREVLATLQQRAKVRCLGQTAGGSPKHPLYLRADTERRSYYRPRAAA